MTVAELILEKTKNVLAFNLCSLVSSTYILNTFRILNQHFACLFVHIPLKYLGCKQTQVGEKEEYLIGFIMGHSHQRQR